jgi:hypothetical protein
LSTPTKTGGSMMVQRKKLTPSPNRIGKKVNTRNRSRFGPRKRRAQSQSRGMRRRAAGRAAGTAGWARVTPTSIG